MKQSALQQAINFVEKAGKDLTSKSKAMISKIPKSPIKNQRAQKGSQGLATMKDGSTLMSDGTLKQTPISQQYNQRLNTLKNNVLQQHAFSKQAEDYLKGIQLDSFNDPGSAGTYYTSVQKPIASGKTGKMIMKKIKPARIAINPEVFSGPSNYPADVLTHEFMHALDANINAENDASYIPRGKWSGDSYQFLGNLGTQDTKDPVFKTIREFLNNYDDKSDYNQDLESFAQYASPRGNKVLLNKKVRSNYGDIFKPVSKQINTTPVYPTHDMYNDIISKLFPEEEGDQL